MPENDDGSADNTETGGLWDGSCLEKWRLPAPASASLQDIVHLQADIFAVVCVMTSGQGEMKLSSFIELAGLHSV